MISPLSKRSIIAISIVALLGAFSFGVVIGGDVISTESDDEIRIQRPVINKKDGQPSNVDFALFWDVWESLHATFVDRDMLDSQELVYGAIQGMVRGAGDAYTVFLPPEESKIFRENVAGEFGGLGMEIGIRDQRLTVIAPLKGTPAERAGIEAGDFILAVDGERTADMTIDEAVRVIRGPKGEPVTLTIFRVEEGAERDITVVRDIIQIPVMEWEFARDENDVETSIAHIQLFHFTETASTFFRQIVTEVLSAGADGIILDLRGNPGGFLEVSVDIASWFVDPGTVIAIERFGPDRDSEYRSVGHPSLVSMPVVVLVDGGSASASEILAGALRDLRGIIIVGKPTFGKGSVQELKEFQGGSTLKVTIAKWLTPFGTSIQDDGITPDIDVEPFAEGTEDDTDPPDLQLYEALRLLLE